MSAALAAAIRDASSLLVVTGAGVSLASGIATFRGSDPDAVWANDIMEKGTLRCFRRHPGASWQWYSRRFGSITGKQPNPAHTAIVALEQRQHTLGRGFTLVTQNVDGLHRAAGSKTLIEIHGSASRVRCARDGCEHGAPRGSLPADRFDFTAVAQTGASEDVPTCPSCGASLRPHVLWFDEYYTGHRDYRYDDALTASKRADVVVFVGTSFAVGITASIVETALQRGRAIFSIDPVSPPPHPRIDWLQQPAEVLLPEIVAGL